MVDPDWLGRTVLSDAGWSHLERLVDAGNRMAGSDGERAAAEATRDALAEHADGARLEPFDVQGWARGDSAIETDDGTQDCIALPRSPSETADGDFVDLGHGLPADFEGTDLDDNVVMVRSDVPDHFDRFVHRREKYYRAIEAGASAFVFANHVPGCLPPTGSVGSDDRPIGDVPAVGVSREVGARLARRHEGDRVAVSVDAAVGDATSQNVHAELGPETDRRVLVTSHVDAHDIAEGALDNGAGTAMVVELARAVAERADELDVRVEFVAFGAEEVGLVGSSRDAAGRDHEAVKAVINLDGVVRGRTAAVYTHGFDPLGEAAREAADAVGFEASVRPEMNPHSDHWPFVQHGVPGAMVMSETDHDGRGWGHTAADTLDKLDRRDFVEQAALVAEYVLAVADDDLTVEHEREAVIEQRLEAEDLATGLRLAGDWPY